MAKLSLKYKMFIIFAAGAAAAFAFAPTYYFVLLFISFPTLLFFLFNANSYKEAFIIGWTFGCGYFLSGLYWIANALLITEFYWVIPIAIVLAPSILALYIGIVALISHLLNKKDTAYFALSFICIWVMLEIFRSIFFTGFPWLALGYSLTPFKSVIQSASFGGVFLISFIVLCLVSVPFLILNAKHNKEQYTRPVLLTVVFVLIFIINYGYGQNRLQGADVKFAKHKIRIVQPNINQDLKWSGNHQHKNLLKVINLTTEHALEKDTYIIWPESVAGIYRFDDKNLRNFIKKIIPANSYLFAGGIRQDKDKGKAWNSVFILDSRGNIVDIYDKKHLVPFGEYIPFRSIIPSYINKVTYGAVDFSAGELAKTITINENLPTVRPLVCYESLFAHDLFYEHHKPDVFINFTNDAWYGDSPGPHQHLDITIFRSVEFGTPMIRAANTGISAISDSYGRVLQQLPLNKEGVIESNLPLSIAKKTLYSIYGDSILIIFLLSLLVTITAAIRKR